VIVRYQGAGLVVVDKPAGLPTQAARGGGDNLFDQLRALRPYVGLHHRLDTAVSGLVLFTLDPDLNAPIARAFREHAIARTYLAVAVGEVATTRWERPVDGAPARTRVEVVGTGAGLTALRLWPETGRKHQLRIHAALAGAPLAGDRRHGGDAGRAWPRLALHATALGLTHPATGEEVEVRSPLPDELSELWARASTNPPVGRGPG
jgi:23S rRNA-/tRNA-specific pseudouridylate synthase